MKKFTFLISLLVVFLTGCSLLNQRLVIKMIEKYSDDQNYVTLTGEVIEFDRNFVVIKCEELNDFISYEDELCDLKLDVDKFNTELSLKRAETVKTILKGPDFGIDPNKIVTQGLGYSKNIAAEDDLWKYRRVDIVVSYE